MQVAQKRESEEGTMGEGEWAKKQWQKEQYLIAPVCKMSSQLLQSFSSTQKDVTGSNNTKCRATIAAALKLHIFEWAWHSGSLGRRY